MQKFFAQLMGRYNQFTKDSTNYLIATIFEKGIVFLTIPIFTRLLSTSDYGYLTIFQSLSSMFVVFTTLGSRGAIIRYYHEKELDFRIYFSSNVFFFLVYAGLFFLLVLSLSDYISKLFDIPVKLINWTAFGSSISVLLTLYLAYLQASGKSRRYAAISIIRTILIIGMSILLVINMTDERYYGRIYGQIIISVILLFYIGYLIRYIIDFDFDFNNIKLTLKFGFPLMPHMLAGFALAFFDRIIINQLVGSSEAGIYALSYNVGMILHVFIMAVNKAWVPFFYSQLNVKNNKKLFKYLKIYFNAVLLIGLILISFSSEIILLFAPPEYIESAKLVIYVVIGYVFLFLYTIYSGYAFYLKKTGLISIFTVLAGAFNIIFNYLLIPHYGYKIAAVTTLCSYVLLFIFHFCNTKYVLRFHDLIPMSFFLKGTIFFCLSIVLIIFFNLKISNIYLLFCIKLGIIVLFSIINLKIIKKVFYPKVF